MSNTELETKYQRLKAIQEILDMVDWKDEDLRKEYFRLRDELY